MSLHDVNGGAPNRATSGRFSTKFRPVSDLRHRARRTASRFFAVAVASSGSVASVARTLGVSERQVTRWMDPDHEAAITFGDILAMPVAQCLQLLDMARAHRERDVVRQPEEPARRSAALMAAAAQAVQALASHDSRAAARALRQLEDVAARAAVDLVPDSSRTLTKE